MPEGPQSVPRVTVKPTSRTAGTSVVMPYSHRLDSGDHTTVPPGRPAGGADACRHRVKCEASRAHPWMAISPGWRQPARSTSSNSDATREPGWPSPQW